MSNQEFAAAVRLPSGAVDHLGVLVILRHAILNH